MDGGVDLTRSGSHTVGVGGSGEGVAQGQSQCPSWARFEGQGRPERNRTCVDVL